MNISVIGRQFTITQSIRDYVESRVNAILQDITLKVSSVNVVMEREKNRFKSTVVFNCKAKTLTSEIEDFELYKSFDSALAKVENQLTAMREKLREHRDVSLRDSEAAKAEAAAQTANEA